MTFLSASPPPPFAPSLCLTTAGLVSMPKRWLSRRERPRNNEPSVNTALRKTSQDFDFAFSDSPVELFNSTTATVTALPVPSNINEQPVSAGGIDDGRSNKKLRIQVPRNRPSSSHDHRPSMFYRSHRASRSVDGLIGLAFGSPTHPPMAFSNLAQPLSPTRPDPVHRHRGKAPHLQPIKWKKIGALLRGRSALNKGKDPSIPNNFALVQAEDLEKANDQPSKKPNPRLDISIPDRPARVPPQTPAAAIDDEHDGYSGGRSVSFEATPPSSAELTGPPKQLTERPVRMSSLPRLEVEISNQPLERYTVIMSNLPAASRSSSLLARRTKAVGSLTASGNTSRNTSPSETETVKSDGKLMPVAEGEMILPRRMTSPTMPKPPFAFSKSEASPFVSKYSLFPPASPAPIKIVGRVPFDTTLKRSATSPARLSPMQDQFPASKPQPLNSKRSAEKNPLSSSTDHTDTWSTSHSLQSSMSSSTTMEEIYFDIKSFRDSKGIEDGQQFVINRPDSTVVHLARTRSKLNAASRTYKQGNENMPSNSKPTLSSLRNEILDKHASVNTVNTAVFDEVIAAVEELATPVSAREQQVAAKSTVTSNAQSAAGRLTMSKADLNMKLLPPDPVLPTRSGRDQIGRSLPSPVLEEISPLSKKSRSSEKPSDLRSGSPASTIQEEPTITLSDSPSNTLPHHDQPSKLAESPPRIKEPSEPRESLNSARVAAIIKAVDNPIEDSPTIPQGPPPRKPVPIRREEADDDDKPPPVPKKDAKFIPVSKFAAKHTVAKLEQTGIRASRPARSATDTSLTSSPQLHSHKLHQGKITGRAERSVTLPIPQGQQRSGSSPQPNRSEFPQYTSNSNSTSTLPPSAKPDVVAPAHVAAVVRATPTAEVSVARTVSLSRKQSARVLLPGPKLAARRAAAAGPNVDGGAGTDSGADTPTTVLSVANSPALGGESPRVMLQEQQQQQLRPKVVVVEGQGQRQGRENTLRVNPLRSHPSPPSILVSESDLNLDGNGNGNGGSGGVASVGTATTHVRVQSRSRSVTPTPASMSVSVAGGEDPDKVKAREKIKLLKEQAREKIASEANAVDTTRAASAMSRTEDNLPKKRDSEIDRQMIAQYKETDTTKWEIFEKRAMSPVLMEEKRYGHKLGLSVGVVLDSA